VCCGRRPAGRSPSALDIGGDKVVPYFRAAEEENPALGWRAIRLSLDRPGLLRTQLAGAAEGRGRRRTALMLPMITDVNELAGARDHQQGGPASLPVRLRLPRGLQFGAMLEVPSLLWQLDELMEEVDFVSVGSNDLFQFMMAPTGAIRAWPIVSTAWAVRSCGHAAADRRSGRSTDTPLTLCGELPASRWAAMALARNRFPQHLDVAGGDRAGQVDAVVAGSGQA
jgi:phosphotransferase system enzyme I (PtsP)